MFSDLEEPQTLSPFSLFPLYTKHLTVAGQWWSCVWRSLHDWSVTAVPLNTCQAAEWERILQEKKKASLTLNKWNQATFHTLRQKSVGEKRGHHIEQKTRIQLALFEV